MPIISGNLTFKFRLSGDVHWQTFQHSLDHFRKRDMTDEETLSEEIQEAMYAMDDRTYDDSDNVEYNVESFWYDIVMPAHKALYGHGAHSTTNAW